MNCKIGDLAIIVSSLSFPENIGAIVEVVNRSEYYVFGYDWLVQSVGRELAGSECPGGTTVYGHLTNIADAQLKPVSGLPDTDTVDDTQPVERNEVAA